MIIPDSNISLNKSLPSLVLSPTPAKTESPPWPFAILLINSWIKTVFPTPAPPNNPILPPFAYGSIRSITLIPVNKTSVEVDKSSNFGASLWIGNPSSVGRFSIPSIASPITLKTLPLMFSPAGILIGAPVATTSTPLLIPSVVSIAIALTVSSPMCCWHSRTNLLPLSLVISNESYMFGNSFSLLSKTTSTTGPIICETFPVLFDMTFSFIF